MQQKTQQGIFMKSTHLKICLILEQTMEKLTLMFMLFQDCCFRQQFIKTKDKILILIKFQQIIEYFIFMFVKEYIFFHEQKPRVPKQRIDLQLNV